MKSKCPNCKYIFEVETGYNDISEDNILCPNCDEEINISTITEYNETDDFEYINTTKWTQNKIISLPTNSSHMILIGLLCIIFGIVGIVNSIIHMTFLPNIIFFIIFLIYGLYIFVMYFCGKIEFSIGKDSSYFIGFYNIGLTKNLDWNNILKIYLDESLFRKGKRHYLVFKYKINKKRINITLLDEENRHKLVNELQRLRYKKIVD